MLVALWPRANDAGRIDWVSRRRDRLVQGWVTVYGHTVLACNLPSRPTHPSTISRMEMSTGTTVSILTMVVVPAKVR